MTKRDKIMQAAVNIEGSAVMLSEMLDCYLIGYTIHEESKTVFGVYDMTEMVNNKNNVEGCVTESLSTSVTR